MYVACVCFVYVCVGGGGWWVVGCRGGGVHVCGVPGIQKLLPEPFRKIKEVRMDGVTYMHACM